MVDDCSKECLAIYADVSISGLRLSGEGQYAHANAALACATSVIYALINALGKRIILASRSLHKNVNAARQSTAST